METRPESTRVFVNGEPLANIEFVEAEQFGFAPGEQPPESVSLTDPMPPLEVTVNESAAEKLAQLAGTLSPFMKWAEEAMKAVARAIGDYAAQCTDHIMREYNDNPRWWHLYKHSKKARIRKKYRKRLMEQARRKMAAAGGAEK